MGRRAGRYFILNLRNFLTKANFSSKIFRFFDNLE
uniref:Uncharacterized protein n=1 Tax=Ackermannviridae sp. ctUml7 TaxID=2825753 RepID=A0A8S5V9M9_9CAUD|nr:MAG TPA: hypothetical protein [Ackermannviridae sp. ctUml7]